MSHLADLGVFDLYFDDADARAAELPWKCPIRRNFQPVALYYTGREIAGKLRANYLKAEELQDGYEPGYILSDELSEAMLNNGLQFTAGKILSLSCLTCPLNYCERSAIPAKQQRRQAWLNTKGGGYADIQDKLTAAFYYGNMLVPRGLETIPVME